MKNKNRVIFFFLFIYFIFGSGLAGANVYRTLKVDFKLGRKGNSCHGFGICLIYIPDGMPKEELSSLSLQGEHLVLELPFSKTLDEAEKFEGENFIMEEEYVLPYELCRELNINYELILAPGKYPLIKTDRGFQIEFSIEK